MSSLRLRLVVAAAVIALPVVADGRPQDLPRGTIVDDVKCGTDPAQSYALYLPSAYSADRKWNLLIAFHPGARGREGLEICRVGRAIRLHLRRVEHLT